MPKKKRFKEIFLKKYNQCQIFCFFCGNELSQINLTIDHIIAKRRGGTNRQENLVPACSNCNNYKSNHLYRFKKRLIKKGIPQARILSFLEFAKNKVPKTHKKFDL